MLLPSKATKQDIDIICAYLANKPEGATVFEASGAFETADSDGQKRSAITQLGFIGKDSNGLTKVTERGHNVAAGDGKRTQSYLAAIRGIPAYMAVIEHAFREARLTITSAEVLADWQKRFASGLSKTAAIRNSQAACLLHLMEGADLGRISGFASGKKRQFAFDEENLRKFANESDSLHAPGKEKATDEADFGKAEERGSPDAREAIALPTATASREVGTETPQGDTQGAKRVFITCGANRQILDQVRDLVAFGKLEAVAEQSREPSLNPLREEVVNVMRSCQAAVIHAGAGRVLREENGKEVRLISEDALIQLGAAIVIFGRNIMLLVEEGVELPAALPELRECRTSGKGLDGASIMTLITALKEIDSN